MLFSKDKREQAQITKLCKKMKKVLKNNLNKKNQFLIDAAKSNVDKVLNNVNSTVNGLSNEI